MRMPAALSREEWRDHAVAFIARFVRTAPRTFSANDLWAGGLTEPADARWVNHALLRAEKQGLIKRTGAKVPSARGAGVPICLWEVAA